MNTEIRSTLSTATALGLVSFVTTSAIVSSIAAPATVTGIGLLAVYGVIEIALASYAGPRFLGPLSAPSTESNGAPRAAVVVAFPSAGRRTLAHAA
jgi:hypothetical protein